MHPDLITTSVWDEPKNVDALKSMWTDGASAAEIARALGQGISREAVLGKVHRLKLPKRDNVIRARPSAQRGNPGQPRAKGIIVRAENRGAQGRAFKLAEARKQGLSTKEAMPLVLGRKPFREGSMPVEDAGVDVTSLIGFVDRRIGKDCAWIFGEPTDGAMCCGKPVKEGTEWCPEHHARIYKKAGSYE